MRRIVFLIIFFIYSCFTHAIEVDELVNSKIPKGFCLYKTLKKDSLSIQILLKSDDCKEDNNSEAIVRLISKKNDNNQIIIQSNKVLPIIPENTEYSFEGERDIRLANGYLEVEVAYPNRVLSEAYSIIFIFKIDNNDITFYDYKVNDLCYIPEEEKCLRRNMFSNESNMHESIRSIFYGKSLSEFDTDFIYNKIYNLWHKVDEGARINSNRTYLYNTLNKITNMYLIKGDKVTILDEQTDNTNQKWYFINYKGKKDINMWIKAEAVDVTE